MKTYILPMLLLGISTLVSAKPVQFYKPYKNTVEVENIVPKQYVLKEVKVTLNSKINPPDFLDQEKIQARYIQAINEYLISNNLLANEQTVKPIELNFDIQQKRVFAGEDLKFISSKIVGKYAHSVVNYKSNLKFNHQELASFNSGENISIGKNGNIGKIFRDISGNGKPENELEDIDGFAKFMIDQLPRSN